MKNQQTIIRTFIITVLFIICSTQIKSQGSGMCCGPFTITNNLDCNVTINWEVVDGSCNFHCGQNGLSITANNSAIISAACCVNGFDIYVTVVNPFFDGVNGLVNPLCGNGGVLVPTASGSVGPACSPGSLQYNMSWTCSGVTINQ